MLIAQRSFYGVSWLTPERRYTIEQVRTIYQKTSLSLAPYEHHIFVLEDAHALNLSSANSLLKLLEEPPPRYHFLLLSPYPEMIVPTIRSRCIITKLTGILHEPETPLLRSLCPPQLCSPTEFNTFLETDLPLERNCAPLIEQLLARWSTHYHNAIATQEHMKAKIALQVHHKLIAALKNLPLSGSSKLFWKNLYMQLHTTTKQQEFR